MSIEENPRVLVKNAEIELTGDELKQIKYFVIRNKKNLLKLINQKIDILDFVKFWCTLKNKH